MTTEELDALESAARLGSFPVCATRTPAWNGNKTKLELVEIDTNKTILRLIAELREARHEIETARCPKCGPDTWDV